MDAKTKELFLTHTKVSDYKRKIAEAANNIRNIYRKYNTVSVSVSGGKDSIVMLDLAIKNIMVNTTLIVWHWDYGVFMPRPIEKEVLDILIKHFKLKEGINLFIDKRYSRNKSNATGYQAFFGALDKHVRNNSIDCCLIGFRREESCSRKKRTKNLLEQSKAFNCYNAFPIKELSYLDIWGYIVKNNIPYPSTYDKMAKIKSWKESRFVTFFDREFEHLDQTNKFLFWKYKEK